jgi:hypothetical protein
MFTPLNAELIHLGRSLFHRGFAETSAADLTGVTQILYYYILSVNVRVGPWLIFDLSADLSANLFGGFRRLNQYEDIKRAAGKRLLCYN